MLLYVIVVVSGYAACCCLLLVFGVVVDCCGCDVCVVVCGLLVLWFVLKYVWLRVLSQRLDGCVCCKCVMLHDMCYWLLLSVV